MKNYSDNHILHILHIFIITYFGELYIHNVAITITY